MADPWLRAALDAMAAAAARFPRSVPDVVWESPGTLIYKPSFAMGRPIEPVFPFGRPLVHPAWLKMETSYAVPRGELHLRDGSRTLPVITGIGDDRRVAKSEGYRQLYGGRLVIKLNEATLEQGLDRWTVRARIPLEAHGSLWHVWRERQQVDLDLGRGRYIVGPVTITSIETSVDSSDATTSLYVVFEGTGQLRVPSCKTGCRGSAGHGGPCWSPTGWL